MRKRRRGEEEDGGRRMRRGTLLLLRIRLPTSRVSRATCAATVMHKNGLMPRRLSRQRRRHSFAP